MLKPVISTRTHGIFDYVSGTTLLAVPKLFRVGDVRRSARIPQIAGAGATAYSLLTDYELGAANVLPMRAHLALDAVSGALLAASPWLFRSRKYGKRHWVPHTLVGATEVAVALATKTKPPWQERGSGRRRALSVLAASSGLAAAAYVARRQGAGGAIRKRLSRRSSDEQIFSSEGVATTGEQPGAVKESDVPPTSSETPGTSAPAL